MVRTFVCCFVPSSKNPVVSNKMDVNVVDPAFGARQTKNEMFDLEIPNLEISLSRYESFTIFKYRVVPH